MSQVGQITSDIFPASTTPFRPNVSFGYKETTFYTTTLATDVCLSGDYYLSYNLQISEQPICPDGSAHTWRTIPTEVALENQIHTKVGKIFQNIASMVVTSPNTGLWFSAAAFCPP
jgi:hypothetical protein